MDPGPQAPSWWKWGSNNYCVDMFIHCRTLGTYGNTGNGEFKLCISDAVSVLNKGFPLVPSGPSSAAPPLYGPSMVTGFPLVPSGPSMVTGFPLVPSGPSMVTGFPLVLLPSMVTGFPLERLSSPLW